MLNYEYQGTGFAGPHGVTCSGIRWRLDNSADIRSIEQMLGHVSIGTTEIYTHVRIVRLKHAMTHPTLQGKAQSQDEGDVDELPDALDEKAAAEH